MILCKAVWSPVCAIPPFCNCKMHYSTTSSKNFLIIDYWNATQSVYCMCRCLHIWISCTSSGQVGNGLQWWGGLCLSPDSLSLPTCVSLDWSVRDLLACQDAVAACRPAFFTNSVTDFSTGTKKHVCSTFSLLLCLCIWQWKQDFSPKILRFKCSQGSLPNGVCRQ
jgi:hypothetical protein